MVESPKKEKSREKNAEIDFPELEDLKIEDVWWDDLGVARWLKWSPLKGCAQRGWEWGVNKFYLFTHGTQLLYVIMWMINTYDVMGEYDMLSLPPGDS